MVNVILSLCSFIHIFLMHIIIDDKNKKAILKSIYIKKNSKKNTLEPMYMQNTYIRIKYLKTGFERSITQKEKNKKKAKISITVFVRYNLPYMLTRYFVELK